MKNKKSRKEILQDYKEGNLALYATKSKDSKRDKKEEEHKKEFRIEFQIDKNRIVYSRAFRRLQSKTQLFVYFENDHYRRRLTHTLEVSEVATTISRNLYLNEDLTEAIALGHDLGHTPFGHAGERALDKIMRKKRIKKYAYDETFFDHYNQGIKVVEELESPYEPIFEFRGLNLTDKTREGILRHFKNRDKKKEKKHYKNKFNTFTDLDKPASLEAQVVRLADYLTCIIHDLEDGFAAKIINDDDLLQSEFFKSQEVKDKKDEIEKILRKKNLKDPLNHFYLYKRTLMSKAIINAVLTSLENLDKIITFKDVISHPKGDELIKLSEEMIINFADLYDNLVKGRIQSNDRVKRMDFKGAYIIKELFEIYSNNEYSQQILPNSILRHYNKYKETDKNPNIIICNYIASMTDAYAMEEYNRLFSPRERI